MFLWVEWISLEAFKSAVRKNFRFLKVVVSWLLPSEEEAVALPGSQSKDKDELQG